MNRLYQQLVLLANQSTTYLMNRFLLLMAFILLMRTTRKPHFANLKQANPFMNQIYCMAHQHQPYQTLQWDKEKHKKNDLLLHWKLMKFYVNFSNVDPSSQYQWLHLRKTN